MLVRSNLRHNQPRVSVSLEQLITCDDTMTPKKLKHTMDRVRTTCTYDIFIKSKSCSLPIGKNYRYQIC